MDLGNLAARLAPKVNPLRFRQGTIVSVDSDFTLTVTVAGSSVPVPGVHYAVGVQPVAGNSVWLATDGSDMFAVATLMAADTVVVINGGAITGGIFRTAGDGDRLEISDVHTTSPWSQKLTLSAIVAGGDLDGFLAFDTGSVGYTAALFAPAIDPIDATRRAGLTLDNAYANGSSVGTTKVKISGEQVQLNGELFVPTIFGLASGSHDFAGVADTLYYFDVDLTAAPYTGRFTSAPHVVVTPQYTMDSADTRHVTCSVSNVTSAGFRIYFHQMSGTAVTVHWIATSL